MSHALATVLHRGRKAASNIIAACLASSRGGTLRNESPRSRKRLAGTCLGLLNARPEGGRVINPKSETYVSG